MDRFCEFLDELLEPVDFEGGAHDDEQVRFLGEIGGLDAANIIPERMRFVV